MTDDLSTLLHALADRIGTRLDALSRAPSTAHDDAHVQLAALRDGIDAIAQGDVSLRRAKSLEGTPDGVRVTAALRKVRELVLASRASVAAGTGKIDEVRSAAERAADGAAKQRLAVERTVEQLRQLVQRAQDLATSAGEIGEMSDRAALLALNTGIEGLRVGGEVARTLGSLGDELRKLAQRTSNGARDLEAGLGAMSEQTKAAVTSLEEARSAARQASDEATRAAGAADAARRADTALASATDGFRVVDDETEAVLVRLDAMLAKMKKDVEDARGRLGAADETGRAAIREALGKLEAALREPGT